MGAEADPSPVFRDNLGMALNVINPEIHLNSA